ncbi:hypothetical protein BOTBODRAFT_38194, partial [Botryobasidium botryosum FD-172 SS1]
MTLRIQPLDASIIRTFKAHYRHLFLHRALDRDESGEANIYQINQLEAMHMIRDAWALVSVQTVVNCWAHTGILNNLAIDEISAKMGSCGIAQAHELVDLPGEDVTEAIWTEEDVVNEVRKEQEADSDLDEGAEMEEQVAPSVPEAMENFRRL